MLSGAVPAGDRRRRVRYRPAGYANRLRGSLGLARNARAVRKNRRPVPRMEPERKRTRVEVSIPGRIAFQSSKRRSWAARVLDSWRRGLGHAFRSLAWPRIHVGKAAGKDVDER